jgi:6-phosphogluconolactonase
MKTSIRRMARCAYAAAVLAALTACGGGDSGPATYTVGGTVTGLTGSGLVLQNYDVNLPVNTSGAFTFGTQLVSGTSYAVGVVTQPTNPNQLCMTANDTGTIGAANVTNVLVTCEAVYTVGGTVSGLVGSGLVLQVYDRFDDEYDGSPLHINADGAFTLDSVFPATPLNPPEFVVVEQQPSSPTQHCLVENALVNIQSANDTSVVVACSEFSYVTNAADNTVSVYRIDATTGALVAVGTPTATGKSPYAVVGTPFKQFVYVSDEGSNDVSAFSVNIETGALTAVSGSPFAAGTNPRALTLYGAAYLYVANTGSDTLSAFAINATTGALTPLSPATYATGHGPSSVAVDPAGSFLYVANNGGSNDISAFVIDAAGGLTPVAGSPFAAGTNPLSLAFGAGGKFLYTANPGGANPSISGFTVDLFSGTLTPLSGSPFPAAVSNYIAADRVGAYLYVTTGAGVVGFGVDATTGLLTSLPGFPLVSGANAYSVTLDPTSQFLYVANNGSANVSGFRIDASTGGLTPITGSPFAAGNLPDFIATF